MSHPPFHEALTSALRLSGKTQVQLAAALHVSSATVSRWCKGSNLPSASFVGPLEEALRAPLRASWERANNPSFAPPWARQLDSVEQHAVSVTVISPFAPPGYLQAPEYARRMIRAGQPWISPDELEDHVAHRCGRLEQLPHLSVTAVFPLASVSGFGTEVGALQAAHLLEWAASGRVAVHVTDSWLPVPAAPLSLFTTGEGRTVAISDAAIGTLLVDETSHPVAHNLSATALGAALPVTHSLKALENLR